ncbi:hypothetical protein FHG87_010254 [Trinorchestia longiramus]|nr:hypothetical protein FHG87_010254 [Trinorchestia longiramus]
MNITAPKTEEVIYIKSEVPDCEAELISVKEEPTESPDETQVTTGDSLSAAPCNSEMSDGDTLSVKHEFPDQELTKPSRVMCEVDPINTPNDMKRKFKFWKEAAILLTLLSCSLLVRQQHTHPHPHIHPQRPTPPHPHPHLHPHIPPQRPTYPHPHPQRHTHPQLPTHPHPHPHPHPQWELGSTGGGGLYPKLQPQELGSTRVGDHTKISTLLFNLEFNAQDELRQRNFPKNTRASYGTSSIHIVMVVCDGLSTDVILSLDRQLKQMTAALKSAIFLSTDPLV